MATSVYLDEMMDYMPILEHIYGMTIERPEPRQLKVTNGLTSCTIQFPAYVDASRDLRPKIQDAVNHVKSQTLKLMEMANA